MPKCRCTHPREHHARGLCLATLECPCTGYVALTTPEEEEERETRDD